MSNEENPEVVPDYGTTLVWSNDDERSISLLLESTGQDLDKAVAKLFRAGNTSYAQARSLSERVATGFGLTPVEFMKKYRAWRQGKFS